MSPRIFIITLFTLLIGTIMPVAASVEEREAPSNLAVWIFLAFCALIIVAQLGTLLVGPSSLKGSEDMVEHEKAREHSEPIDQS